MIVFSVLLYFNASSQNHLKIENISQNQEVSGNLVVKLDTANLKDYRFASYHMDDKFISTIYDAPFTIQFDTRDFENGKHTFYVKAFREDGIVDIDKVEIKVGNIKPAFNLIVIAETISDHNTNYSIMYPFFGSLYSDDIHSQAAFASILAHPDGIGINYYAVAGAYGTQTGKYINSNSLFEMAFGEQNTNWNDANTDRANSVIRIVAKIKPILEAGGWAWVQEAGQSDITADWVAAVLLAGVPAATVKNNVIVVQHSRWNEGTTTTADLTFVKSKTTYVEIDDGNVNFGVYSTDRPKRQVQTPGFVSANTTFMTEALSANNPNKKVREYWIEADRIIKASGFNASYSEIPKGGVDFSDCVENWSILGLGEHHFQDYEWRANI